MLPDVVRRVAECAPGKRVTVCVAGKSYGLPIIPEPPKVEAPIVNPLAEAAAQLLTRDAESRSALEAIAERTDRALRLATDAVATVAAGQAQIVESVKGLEGALHLPVRPIYDQSGKVVGAKRCSE